MKTVDSKRFTKKERSWIMYDWANSVYATNIMAAILPPIFVEIAGRAGQNGDLLWGYGTSFATLIIAILAPILGSIADYQGMKKKLFSIFMFTGVIATAAIALSNDWRMMLLAYIISRIGFSGSNLFYDSFLTDVTTNERMDKVSSWGYAMGYIGGSTIPFVVSIAVLLARGAGDPFAQKFSILITSVWWLAFSIPFLRNVEQEHYLPRPERISLGGAFTSVLQTARDILRQKGLLLFIAAYFFYIDGVGTVISISTAYGSALGLGLTGMILALLVTQIVAMPCSILFAKLAQKISTRKAILIAISVYMLITLVGFYMGFSLEPHQDAYQQAYDQRKTEIVSQLDSANLPDQTEAETALNNFLNKAATKIRTENNPFEELKMDLSGISAQSQDFLTDLEQTATASLLSFQEEEQVTISRYRKAVSFSTILFWCMAVLVGTMQGGIQAVSRSYYGKLVPKHRSNEYFGFFDIFGKFAAVVGPLLYALVGSLTGRSSYGTLCITLLFLIGFVILLAAKKPLEELEASQALAERKN